ncbi:DMT family transporter [Oryzifoliimicrobium ureilyticus]|uniref:DMT family transporter n=1 Tax=Oryzifoliimicrobium ureilyticus TaxID=3113724 RepID=UPI003075F959
MSTRHATSNRAIATLVGAVGVVLWATETMLVTLTTSIPPLQTVTLSFFFAAAMSPFVWLITGAHPLEAFRQPPRVWVLTVGSLVGYHGCIYYATQQAPPTAAALLQSTTPLIIVLASAFLPGERLRWWHVVGAMIGFLGVLLLVDTAESTSVTHSSVFYLALIGIAAGFWGLYSVIARLLPDVPSTALGMFYAVSGLITFFAHLTLETWVAPTPLEWIAIAGLGVFPMGLAIYLWDYGLKKGDMQALGAFSYVEPFIGAVFVAICTGVALTLSLLWSGLLVVAGAVIASASLWEKRKAAPTLRKTETSEWLALVSKISSEDELQDVKTAVLTRLSWYGQDEQAALKVEPELRALLQALMYILQIEEGLSENCEADNCQSGRTTADICDVAA